MSIANDKRSSYLAGWDMFFSAKENGDLEFISKDLGENDDFPPDDYYWLLSQGVDPDFESYREGFNDARKELD